MIKRISLLVLLAFFSIAMIFTGCSSKQSVSENSSDNSEQQAKKDTGDLIIAGIYKMGDAIWFIEEGKASANVCKKMGAKDFLYIDVKTDANLFLQALDNVIAQKVDGVLTCIPDQKLSKVAIEKLTNAGIPVIAVDDPLQDESGNKLAPWVGIDAYNIGAACGEWMANYMKDNGLDRDPTTGILFLTAETVSSCVPRTEGEKEMIKQILPHFPEDRMFFADHKTDMDSGFNAANSIITGNPQIKKWMVLSVSDDGAVGAVRALEQAGLDKQSCAIGLGGYLGPGEFEKEYSAFKAAAYFSARDVGETAAKFLMEYIKDGKEIPKEYAVGAKIVTKENYKELMPEYVK